MWKRANRESRAQFLPMDAVGDLDRAFVDSRARPVIIYLHDPHCGVSAVTLRRMEAIDQEVWLLDVSRAHDVKRAVASRTGVRHASPQVIVLRDERVAWHASHLRITREGVERAVAAAAGV